MSGRDPALYTLAEYIAVERAAWSAHPKPVAKGSYSWPWRWDYLHEMQAEQRHARAVWEAIEAGRPLRPEVLAEHTNRFAIPQREPEVS